jgi:hypothetical protein
MKEIFITKLRIQQPHLFNNYLLEEIHYKNNHEKFLLEDKFGRVFLTTGKMLLRNYAPTILSCVNKEEYLRIELLNKGQHWINDFKFINFKYVNDKSILRLEDRDGNIFAVAAKNLIKMKQTFSILSAENKNNYFIYKAKTIHGNKYSYKNSKYKDCHSRSISINCKIHGDFITTYQSHITHKRGCPLCGKLNMSGNYSNYNKKEPNKILYLYLVELSKDEEQFYKVGLTKDINRRFKQFGNYNVKIIELIKDKSKKVVPMELDLKNSLKTLNLNYTPNEIFGGYTECFKW